LATLRFHLPADALERLCFSYGPVLEAVFSLHVLVQPQRYPLHHPFIRQMRELPLSLRREMAALSFVLGDAPPSLGPVLPNPLGRFPPDTSESFEDGLAHLRKLSADTITAEFADALAVAERSRPTHDDAALRMAREKPVAFVERVCQLLEDYWDAAFEREWLRLEPLLAGSVAEAGRLLLGGGLLAFLRTLGPRVRTHAGGKGFDVEVVCAPKWGSAEERAGQDVAVPETFTFVPSAFTWPQIWVSVEAPWPLGMTYSPPFVASLGRPRIPPADLVRVLRACGDDTRLRALRWIAERPRSTQELAPLVGITESALSKHLRQLADAGVLQPRRDGHYVLYHLRHDRLEVLTDSLLAYLGPDNLRPGEEP
jgi:DNA-binding transcriptional ArsR family regulator